MPINPEVVAQSILKSPAERVPGGISNINFIHRTPEGGDFLTIYPSRRDWWKIKKDIRVADVLEQVGVSHAKGKMYGIFQDNGERTAFVIKDLIPGVDMDTLLQRGQLSNENLRELMGQLGSFLGKMHSYGFSEFGLIRGRNIAGSENRRTVPAKKTWVEFMDEEVKERTEQILHLTDETKVGAISAKDIKSALFSMLSFYDLQKEVLSDVQEAHLTHNDMRLGNIMTSPTTDGSWQIGAIIDTEWALAGDPDLDLAQIENWLQFAPYQDKFIQNKDAFLEAYELYRKIPTNFSKKKKIYHMLRSLSYLGTVLEGVETNTIQVDAVTEGNVFKHFDMLMSTLQEKPLEGEFIK